MIHFHVITIFPEMFESYLKASILHRAVLKKKIKVDFYNPRDFSDNKHKKVDDFSYGGGPGMVMQAEPILKAYKKAKGQKKKTKTIIFSPGGTKMNNLYAERLSTEYKHIILISGRYEGIDARVKKITRAEEVSIGDYVLTGGELPSMVLIDTVSRHVPGVLGNNSSLEENRISSGEMYTRPQEFKWKGRKYVVPKVLTSGHHKKIEKWRGSRTRNPQKS